MHRIQNENNRLRGRLQGKDENLKEWLAIFVTKIGEKAGKIEVVRQENAQLKKALATPANGAVIDQVPPAEKVVTYAQKASARPTKSKTRSTTKTMAKCRETKSGTRFVTEVPNDKTVAEVKSEIWKTVRTRLPNPRAKTIVSGNWSL